MKHTILTLIAANLLCMPLLAQTPEEQDNDYWLKDVIERFQVNGYAQAGYTYMHQDDKNTNTLDVKRTLLWVKARITDRWSFLFMHDFNSAVQEFYTDYRITNNKALTVRFGQFKNQLSKLNGQEVMLRMEKPVANSDQWTTYKEIPYKVSVMFQAEF